MHNDPSVPTLSHNHPVPCHIVLDTFLSHHNPIHVPTHSNFWSVLEPTLYNLDQLCPSDCFRVSIPSTPTYRKWTLLIVLYSLIKLCSFRLPSSLGSFQTFPLCCRPLSTKVDLSHLKTQSVPRSKHTLPRL